MKYITTIEKDSIVEFYFRKTLMGYAYKDVCGYYYFIFNTEITGHWSDYVIVELGEKMTELNKKWNDFIDDEFKKSE